MGESLSSLTAKNLGLEKSLLERLFEYYPFDLEYKLKLLENFRSYKEIVDLSSHLFYEDSLICNKQRSGKRFLIFSKYTLFYKNVRLNFGQNLRTI